MGTKRNSYQVALEQIQKTSADVSQAAALFESRWTVMALRRIDPELSKNLHDEEADYGLALVRGSAHEVELHGQALCRGYRIAIRRMEEAAIDDDAYALGCDPQSGMKVAVGHQRAAVDRIREIHGQDIVWITPDEVAVLLASTERMKGIAAVKQFFPGAEIIKRYASEGCSDYPDDGGSSDD